MLFLLLSAFSAPQECQAGLTWTRYYNEVEFINPAETKIVDGIKFDHFNFGYNSITVAGSFCPKKSGKYRAQVTGRPFAQLCMDGNRSPGEIGPAGNCWPSTSSQYSIDNLQLDANRCYSFAVNARTGCTLYSQYLFLSFFYENDPTEIFPEKDEYTTCIIDDCLDGFYGEHCTEKCQTDCGAHGFCFNGTKGNGKCICDDHWEGDDCNTAIEIKLPEIPDRGSSYTAYHNEVSFTDPFEHDTKDKIYVDGIGYIFCSLIMKGSIMPERSGEYQFRIVAKPFAQFNFMGTRTPSELGPAAFCNNEVITDYSSEILHLDKHHTYPYEVLYRSGCGLIYGKHIHLFWKNGPKWGGIDNAPWEVVPDFSLFATSEDQCVPDQYGSDCEGTCHECPANMECNDGIEGTGNCKCKAGASDCFCSEDDPCLNGAKCNNGICECPSGFYGEKCQRFCDNETTCHNNGYCSDFGYCVCDSKHTGDNCTLKCTRKDTCNSHGDCIEGGICECDEDYSGNTCAHHDYQKSPKEMEKGVVFTMFNNEFFTGGYAEWPHVIENMDRTFDRLLYKSAIVNGAIVSYNKTKVEVRIRSRPFGQIHLNHRLEPYELGPAGSCIASFETDAYIEEFTMFPNRLYDISLSYRSGCSLIPQSLILEWRPRGQVEWTLIPNENLRANTEGQTCLERYYGEFCNEYCDSDCNMNGDCVMHDGKSTCKCFDSFYGEHCEFHCDPEINCSGNGICYNDQCVCDVFHSGEHCEIGCVDEITCNGHGKCSTEAELKEGEKSTYRCICDEGYEGETCAQHSYEPSLNETQHGVNHTLYTTENFDKAVDGYPKIVDNMTVEKFSPLMFNSASYNAAIVTTSKVQGRIRFTAKPYGQLSFRGLQNLPEKLGPSMSCWYTTVTEEETPEISFIPNKLYHFNFSYRSGCSFFEQHLNLEWQLGTDDWKPIPKENLVVPKDANQVCLDRYFGENCDEYCDLDCSMNGYCIIDENKEKKCQCLDGALGDHCESYCDAKTTCSNHGHCNGFHCVCDAFHSGEHCEIGCIDDITCNGHGKCSTEAKEKDTYQCICDEGYEGETCAQHKYIPSVNESKNGVNLTIYSTEEFDQINEPSSLITNFTQTFNSLWYKSATLESSIVTKSKTQGRIRFTAKPHGQLIIGNISLPNEIGPSSSCWGWTVTENETSELTFNPNVLYPIIIRFKSGCSFIEQKVKVEWLIDSEGWKEIPAENLIVPTNGKDQKCIDRYFGESCDEFCDLDCNMNGNCYIDSIEHSKKCHCLDGFTGDQCETKIEDGGSDPSSSSSSSTIPTKQETEEGSDSDSPDSKDGGGKSNKDKYNLPIIISIVCLVVVSIAIVFALVFLIGRKSNDFISTMPLISQNE